ncbi:MAG: metal ABC transporter permease [Candidatus Hodarchaeales archaeon]|jgi:iron/zinc/copper transport system permease protein
MEPIVFIGDLIQQFFDLLGIGMFRYPFMQRALMGLLIVSIMTSIIGAFVVLRGHSFLSLGVSSSAFAGFVVGTFLGINPLIVGLAFALLTSLFIEETSIHGDLKPDVTTGIIFSLMLAIVLLLFHRMENPAASTALLYGDALGALKNDIYWVFLVALVVLAMLFAFNKEFQMITFDPSFAEAVGAPVTLIRASLLFLIALTITSSISVVGGLLVLSFLVVPAAAAYQLASRFSTMIVFAFFISSFSAVIGLILAYIYNVGPSASIVVLQSVIFFCCFLFSPKRHTAWIKMWLIVSRSFSDQKGISN